MIEWKNLTSDEIAALDRTIPVILPLGLIEAHGPHLAVSVDNDTAAYFAHRVAQETGAILAPVLNYGFADEMAEYPGTIGLSIDTTISVLTDIACHFCFHGFTKIIFLSGHGANKTAFDVAIHRIWKKYPDARIAYWNYWTEAGLTKVSHADKAETEIAMAVGTVSHPDRAKDFKVDKPWYRLRSRHALNPESGGINGEPTQADFKEGGRVRDEIVRVLASKVLAIVAAGKSQP